MKKSLYISVLSVLLTACCVFCAGWLEQSAYSAVKAGAAARPVEVTVPPQAKQTADTAEEKAPEKTQAEPINLPKGGATVITLSKSDELRLDEWTSSKPETVSVDSGGRIDALKQGGAEITARFTDGDELSVKVTVTEAETSGDTDLNSTAVTANSETLIKNICDTTRNPYSIKVNRRQNCVTVYTYGEDGKYTVPVRAMVCSCGKDNATITGKYQLYFHNEWNALFNDVYGQYVSGITGNFLFHSVPYNSAAPDTLEVEEFNKLGADASLGCVRLAAADAEWIYKNCVTGTDIEIYDSDEAGPLGKPEAIRITDTKCGWDPTDPNPKNPYAEKAPRLEGVSNVTITEGDAFSPLGGVKGYDTCSNDITGRIKYIGNVVTTRAGKYKVSYSVTDALGRACEKTVTVTVRENKAVAKLGSIR